VALVAIALIVSATFAAALAHHLLAGTLCCADDAFNAVAAKNLAAGRGYASSYAPSPAGENGLVRFDPMISTGPALVAPAAVGILVFGNRYWVPGAVALTLDLLLLGAVFAHLAATDGDPRRWALAVVVAVVSLTLVTLGHLPQWYTLLGEIPALLLLCLGVLRALDARGRWRDHALGGLLLGCAYLTKALAMLAVPLILGFLVLSGARAAAAGPGGTGGASGARSRFGRGLRAAAVTALLFCVPPLLFEATKLADLGTAGYREAKSAESTFLESAPGSGLRALRGAEPEAYLRETGARNWRALAAYFGGEWPIWALLATLALGLGARGRWTGRDSPAPLVLIAVAAAFVAWWLPVSGAARVRYLLIGLGVGCLGVVLDLFRGAWSARKTALAFAFATALLPRAAYAGALVPRWPYFQPSPRTLAMLETARFLEAERRDRMIAADWWATGADLEYLLEGTGNLVSHLSLERRGRPPVLFLENAQWIDLPPGIRERWDAALARSGAELAFESPPYRVYAAPSLVASERTGFPREGS
jgi:hypothetical protein